MFIELNDGSMSRVAHMLVAMNHHESNYIDTCLIMGARVCESVSVTDTLDWFVAFET